MSFDKYFTPGGAGEVRSVQSFVKTEVHYFGTEGPRRKLGEYLLD